MGWRGRGASAGRGSWHSLRRGVALRDPCARLACLTPPGVPSCSLCRCLRQGGRCYAIAKLSRPHRRRAGGVVGRRRLHHTNVGSPAPVLYLTGHEYYSTGGKNWVRYQYDVLNKDQYPPDLFTAAPSLAPCGLNANSSRTWVHLFDANGTRLYGFCALGSPDDLGRIWFAREEGAVPPS